MGIVVAQRRAGGRRRVRQISGTQERATLDAEALYLAETLADPAPDDAEAHGLAALICLSTASATARMDDKGHLIPLAEQGPNDWDRSLIDRGNEHLRVAYGLRSLGRYQLEAAIQAVHCARQHTGSTDWAVLRDLHRHLYTQFPSLGAGTGAAALSRHTGRRFPAEHLASSRTRFVMTGCSRGNACVLPCSMECGTVDDL
ncbi:MAG: hypothetical protein KF883_14480 [Thermomicrobiales bacterium]|nr:hypothetical protein [Thermomicrobiales bacterium]